MIISCIVPVYNEEKRLGAVLSILEQCAFLDEVIVVNDCSTDMTSTIIEQYKKIITFTHTENKGKSAAIYTGITHSKGDVLFFIDADLEGLTVAAVQSLAEPIIEDEADMSLSLRQNAPGLWKYIGLDYITGERCFKKDLLTESLEQIPHLDGFELEVFLNKIIIKKQSRLVVVSWPKVISPLKIKCFGIYFDFLYMGIKIFIYLNPFQMLNQIQQMKRQIV